MTRIAAGLTRALHGPDTVQADLDLNAPHRLVVLSDQHKGAGDGADEFRLCKPAYTAALEHYLDAGYTLILLGDVEELWEQSFDMVVRAHEDVLRLEGSFPGSRYIRVWGNHDDRWMNPVRVHEELSRFMPQAPDGRARAFEGVRYHAIAGGERVGTLLMLHGHQGQLLSDRGSRFTRALLPGYRALQRATGIGRTTPAKDACLRGVHDAQLYQWAAAQERLILIAGHTHRPVWMSLTHAQSLALAIEALRHEPSGEQRDREVMRLESELETRLARVPPCSDVPGTVPAYFNAGCCKYADGDITGIEIEDGELRLVKWWSAPGAPGRGVLERARLEELFGQLARGSTRA